MTQNKAARVRLAVDIGGTFSDIALSANGQLVSRKKLTTLDAPEMGVLEACTEILSEFGFTFPDVDLFIHGTTLATNALIERRGARTALVATGGHRDTLELAFEDRFSEYDIFIDKPLPLVPRDLRLTVPERISARGEILLPLDTNAVRGLVPLLQHHRIESLAIGYLHAYANAEHEQQTRAILREALPDLWISISSEVCPEIREYERLSTTCANAYVQPLMAGYLGRLAIGMEAAGLAAPILMIMSGGGLATLDTARSFPIRLVESGPAGGAIFAAGIAQSTGLSKVLSFDMGGTTAKICLIDDGIPIKSRQFEAGRAYRFLKGSGLPLRIPVIEMVEIGAGGGSVASVDTMNRITVGPESAGADPGPACYGRGGDRATVTDCDVVSGTIAPESFAGGTMPLRPELAAEALSRDIGATLELTTAMAAFAVSEIVDENMANTARIHAIELGKSIDAYSIIAFGGAGPLHAARLAVKIGADRIIVPANAGVGSAIGFLMAPIAYEIARSLYMPLERFSATSATKLLAQMSEEAISMVRRGAPDAQLTEIRQVEARYTGQGHETVLALPLRPLTADDAQDLLVRFENAYATLYGRAVNGIGVELLNWTVAIAAPAESIPTDTKMQDRNIAKPEESRNVFDPETQSFRPIPQYQRSALMTGDGFAGPALIIEDQTTTVVPGGFEVTIDAGQNIVMTRKTEAGEMCP